MPRGADTVVAGIDVGGTKTNATLIDETGEFLVDRMMEVPSCVREGPVAAVAAIRLALENAATLVGIDVSQIRAVGLDTPGPASATGVISSRGATNFAGPEWWGFDIRSAVETDLQRPVVYNNDGNAAALYAHERFFGMSAIARSSISAIVGTGLGGGVIQAGRVVSGAAGMAGELGHVHIPMAGLLVDGQPTPRCNCGFVGDLESVASLSGIVNNLLPFWLTRYPDHPLHELELLAAAKEVRSYGESGDEMALKIFEQQAIAIGHLFTIASNFTDPDAFFVGGGVIEAAPHFRDWFIDKVRTSTDLREEQLSLVRFALVPDLDMAGARGSAVAALNAIA